MTTVASQEKPWPVVYDQRDSQSVKVTLNTNTEIVYTGGNRRWLNATVQLYARYSIVWLAIMIALQSTFVCFVSTGGIVKSLNVTPVDDYKQRRWYFVRSSLNLANQNNVGTPRRNNMSLSRLEFSIDSRAATNWIFNNTNAKVKGNKVGEKILNFITYKILITL